MQWTVTAFGEANQFVGLGVPYVETDDARHDFCVRSVVALEGDDDRLRTGRSGRWNDCIEIGSQSRASINSGMSL